MTIDEVIHVRDTLKKIKYTKKKKNPNTGEVITQELSVPLIVKLDNEVYIFETSSMLFWNDSEGIVTYLKYNSNFFDHPIMIGTNKINMPCIIGCAPYDVIQEIQAVLNEDTLNKAIEILKPIVKFYVTDTAESITDEKAKIIISKFCKDTAPQTDYDHYVQPYNK